MLPGALGALLAGGLLAYARWRTAPGARWFAVMAAGVLVWCVTQVVGLGLMPLEAKVVAFQLQYFGILTVAPTFFFFAAAYTGRTRLTAPRMAVVVTPLQVVTLVLVWTNDLHGFVWADIALRCVNGLCGVAITHGPWFWVHTLYQYVLVLSGVAILVWTLAQHQHGFSRQTLAVVSCPFIVAAPNLFFLFSGVPLPIDPTPAAFGVAGTVIGVALLRFGLLDLVPVARAAVIESMSEPVFVLDARGRLIDLNASAERLVGAPMALSLGRALADLAPWCTVDTLQDGPRELVWVGDDGVRTFEATATQLGSRDGLAEGRLLVLRDVSVRAEAERELRAARAALEEANARLAQLAGTDDLTGLANRRVFIERLDAEAARARRAGGWVAVALADLDHFKRINDSHGHAAGDDVLRAAADALRAVARETDLAARVGGEELAVLLPGTDEAGAVAFAERLRAAVEGLASDPRLAARGLRVTTSVGVAAGRGRDLDEARLLSLADERLYQAKRDGRNRVCAGPVN